MKTCPSCHKSYEDETMMFCLDDGTALLQATVGSGDPNATLRMPAPRSTDPGPTVDRAKAPTLVEQPLKAQAGPQPFVSPGFGPAERTRKSPLPWILGIVIVLGLAGIGIAFIVTRALQQQSQQSVQAGTPTASPSEADITAPVSPSSTPVDSSNLSKPATPGNSPTRTTAANAGATPKPKPTTATKPPPEPTPVEERKPTPHAPISGGVLNGKAISLPKPPYPAIARQAHASGTVTVQVLIDEAGNVISAHAVSGHPLLQAVSVAAARQAKFAPTKLSGQPVKVNGVILYNFVAQ
jgi:TonB family protein